MDYEGILARVARASDWYYEEPDWYHDEDEDEDEEEDDEE